MEKQIMGYQVWSKDGELHPQMDASFCVYSLKQCEDMIMSTNPEAWELMIIYDDTIEEPTIMF